MFTTTMRHVTPLFLFSILSFQLTVAAETNLNMAVPFTDNMVLQRQTAVPIWGFDAPRTEVTVEFAGQSKTTITDQNGDWMVKLDRCQHRANHAN
jgi:sialate O-acetylesterase